MSDQCDTLLNLQAPIQDHVNTINIVKFQQFLSYPFHLGNHPEALSSPPISLSHPLTSQTNDIIF